MATIIDLTLPLEHDAGRLGLSNRFEVVYSFEQHGWQGSRFQMFAHMGTHV